MRTDMKIGIAVGLFVAVLAVIYFVLTTGEPAPLKPDQLARQPGPAEALYNQPEKPLPAEREETVIPSYPQGPPRQVEEQPAEPKTVSVAPSDVELEPVTPSSVADVVERKPPGVSPLPPAETPMRTEPVIISVTPAARPPRIGPLQQRTYVVKKGDAGFWGIAENVYGHGKYYWLIAKANPQADSKKLRPGLKLLIPPLPGSGLPARTIEAEAEPKVVLKADQRIYLVQAGDAGFWGIAQKVYGQGKYHRLIAEANPQANPKKLQPGQKLIIPELTGAAREKAASGLLLEAKEAPAEQEDARPIFD